MATRKKTEAEEIVQIAEDAPVTVERDPWEQKVMVRLPKGATGEGNSVIASVNGRVFQIKRGVDVEVPAPIAEVLRNSMEAQDEADEFIEKAASN